MEEKRKIIEIYVEEKTEDDAVSFEFVKCEDTEVADNTMKMLMMVLSKYKREEDDIEVEFE